MWSVNRVPEEGLKECWMIRKSRIDLFEIYISCLLYFDFESNVLYLMLSLLFRLFVNSMGARSILSRLILF